MSYEPNKAPCRERLLEMVEQALAEGETVEEIAEELGCSVGLVQSCADELGAVA